MLKISIVDTSRRRRLVLEGAFVAPWAAELNRAWETARADLDGRKLVLDLKDMIAIDREGEDILLALIKDGVKVRCQCLLARYVSREIARRIRRKDEEMEK